MRNGLAERFRSVLTILRDGPAIAQSLIATRCQRGAEIAALLRFPQGVSDGIYSLDEHYNGQGKPDKLAGDAIPVFSRIALLAQVIDVFVIADGRDAALKEVQRRAGTWFDPLLVAAFQKVAASAAFWATPASAAIAAAVSLLSPVIITVLMPMRRSSAKRSLMLARQKV